MVLPDHWWLQSGFRARAEVVVVLEGEELEFRSFLETFMLNFLQRGRQDTET